MATVCLDLDGTLTDPQVGITRCIRYAMERLDVEPPEPCDLNWCIGPPLLQSFEQLLGDKHRAAEALTFYRERFAGTGMFENNVYNGIPETLSRLTSAGEQLLVATSKPTVYAEPILKHFGLMQYFDGVYGSELDGTRTDKTELLAWIIDQKNLQGAETIMIGDRHHDIIGARNNGLHSIGVLYGYGSRQELTAAGADQLCSLPNEIVDLVAMKRDGMD